MAWADAVGVCRAQRCGNDPAVHNSGSRSPTRSWRQKTSG
jgi:hypothetical protein